MIKRIMSLIFCVILILSIYDIPLIPLYIERNDYFLRVAHDVLAEQDKTTISSAVRYGRFDYRPP